MPSSRGAATWPSTPRRRNRLPAPPQIASSSGADITRLDASQPATATVSGDSACHTRAPDKPVPQPPAGMLPALCRHSPMCRDGTPAHTRRESRPRPAELSRSAGTPPKRAEGQGTRASPASSSSCHLDARHVAAQAAQAFRRCRLTLRSRLPLVHTVRLGDAPDSKHLRNLTRSRGDSRGRQPSLLAVAILTGGSHLKRIGRHEARLLSVDYGSRSFRLRLRLSWASPACDACRDGSRRRLTGRLAHPPTGRRRRHLPHPHLVRAHQALQ
jgi:hypothetical protein